MKRKTHSKVLSIAVIVCMLVSMLPVNVFAGVNYDEAVDDYYKVISKDDYELAPGISESEIVLNNAAGSHRQVAHVVEVDLNNEYTKVIPSYKGMIPKEGSYGVQIMSQQAAWAEANGYGNVVAAMNLSLSWYDNQYYADHPELVGEPLGYMVLDGQYFENSQGKTSGAQTCAVINFDEKDGVARPADIPKVEIRSTSSAITGWEEQVIPANFGFLVKDGKNQYSVDNNANNGASRSFVGIKEDGTFVMVMNDGRQSPYSAGFTNYEMAEFMLSLGCVQAVNGDGGGSSAFLSQRPGEELKLNCSPSDGAERPTTHGILAISTAPATGEFARATITTENDYYTPGSTVEFKALGTDLVGTETEIPADAVWQLEDASMGSIEDGRFISNGKTGTATAQLVYDGEVVGEASVEIVIPENLAFKQSKMTIPFDKTVTLGLKATVNGGLHEVVLKPSDIKFETTNPELGTIDGFKFTSVSEENAPLNVAGTLSATLVHNTSLVAEAEMLLGKGSSVLYDFESSESVDAWNTADVNGNDAGYIHELSHATKENGQVHDGNGSLRVYSNALSAPNISAGGYAQLDLYLDEHVIVENAKSIGFWAYIPDEYVHCWIRVLYWYDSNGDGTYDKKNTVSVINQPAIYNDASEDGWYYFSVDVSAYDKVLIPGIDAKDKIGYNASKNDANNFRFIEFMFPHTNTNDLWKTYGTINGPYTIYVDNITADYSDAVDDREAPILKSVTLAGNDQAIELKNNSVVTTTNNAITATAAFEENTTKDNATGLDASSAKAYVDGVAVDCKYNNGRVTISDVALADGYHRVKFEICDAMGNKTSAVRLIKVESGVEASTVQIVPADNTLDRLYGGSVYWMDVKATDIETIESVKTKIDLNSVNHWELDHMNVAEGFEATYTVDEETNTADIEITRTGKNNEKGEAVLASLPIRVIYYDTDIHIEGYTAESFWKTYEFWPQDVKVDVDLGEITYVGGYESNVLNAFSNEELSVATEMYTSSANMDATFKAERGTAHVHTAKVADVAPGCTTVGYSGRTFCDVCNSIVEWGTEVAATGHKYSVIDGKLACECGDLFNGVHTDGKTYVDGVIIGDGWNGESYYEDGVALTGVQLIDGKYYNFGEDGVCPHKYPMSAEWWTNDKGESRYLNAGVPVTGYNMINGTPTFFDEDGIAFQGEIKINDETCIFEKGAFVESTTADIKLAGLAGPRAYFVLYADGTMVLCGEGETYDYVSTGSNFGPNISWKNRPWGKQDQPLAKSIKKVIVKKDITEVGVYTFYLCVNINEVAFEEGSSLNKIDSAAFCYLPYLKAIKLPESVKAINNTAFAYCERLGNVYIPQDVKSISSSAFNNSEKVVLNVASGTYGENYAKNNSIMYTTRDYLEVPVETGSCGKDATWAFYGNGKLVIDGSGAMDDYSSQSKQPWAEYRNQIKSIVIGKDITHVGQYAFAYAYNVSSVEFEEGCKLESVGAVSFYYILYVKEVVLPETVKSIGNLAFGYNQKLVNVYVPQGTTSIATKAFANSSKIILNVAEGTYAESFAQKNNIGYTTRAFVESVVAEGKCGENVTWTLYESGKLAIDGSGAMDDYSSQSKQPWAAYRNQIKSIVIGKDITHVGQYAFAYAYNVSSVEFEEGCKLESVGAVSFYYIVYVKEVVLPETVKSIGNLAFGYNQNLVNVYVPQGTTSIATKAFSTSSKVVLNVAEGTYAEDYAKKNNINHTTRAFVESVVAEGTCGESTTWTMYESGKLVIGGSGAMDDYSSQSKQPWAAYRNQIKSIVIGKDITHVGQYAFAYAFNVSSVEFEEGCKLESVGAVSFYYILYVKEVVLPETVKHIGNLAFGYNQNLVNVYVPQGTTSIATKAFSTSSKVVLNVAEGTYAEDYAKKNNINHTTRAFVESVVAEGTCGESTTWTIYESGKLVIGGSGAMDDYSSQSKQPWAAYRNQIKSIVIGKDVTHVGQYAFAYAFNVSSVEFEEGCKLESVGAVSFYYILHVKEVVLPESVKSIGNLAFGNCAKLITVSYNENAKVHDNAFNNSPCNN